MKSEILQIIVLWGKWWYKYNTHPVKPFSFSSATCFLSHTGKLKHTAHTNQPQRSLCCMRCCQDLWLHPLYLLWKTQMVLIERASYSTWFDIWKEGFQSNFLSDTTDKHLDQLEQPPSLISLAMLMLLLPLLLGYHLSRIFRHCYLQLPWVYRIPHHTHPRRFECK